MGDSFDVRLLDGSTSKVVSVKADRVNTVTAQKNAETVTINLGSYNFGADVLGSKPPYQLALCNRDGMPIAFKTVRLIKK